MTGDRSGPTRVDCLNILTERARRVDSLEILTGAPLVTQQLDR
jgi:hypothetical protein